MGFGSLSPSRSQFGSSLNSMSEATGTDRKRQMEEISIFHDVAKALTSSLNLDSIQIGRASCRERVSDTV